MKKAVVVGILAIAITLFWALSVSVLAQSPNNWYVSPTGTSGNSGAIGSPWDLQTALNQPAAVHAGDTIWLRGGTYSGIFNSYLIGTLAAPIIVRQYAGERATLDGGTSNAASVLTVVGTYTWFWGFEITSSSTSRTSAQSGPYPTDLSRPFECIADANQAGTGIGIKIINMVIHNCGQGIALWQNATNSEAYGNLVSYNGWNAPDRNHGHGIYSQNLAPSTRTIRNNILYANWDYQVHIYGESAHVDNHTLDGNIMFWDGAASSLGSGANLSCGGGAGIPTGNSITNNAAYASPHGGRWDISSGDDSIVMTGNLAGYAGSNGGGTYLDTQTGTPVITGNKIYGGLITPSNYATLYPSNNWYYWSADYGGPGAKPTGTSWVLVRPNTYEPGRGHVAVFNWSHAASVSVNLSTILSVGASYEIRNAQNFFGAPILSGTYAGGGVSVPMAPSSVEAPVGAAAPSSTGSEFNAFVVLTVPSATPTPTQTTTWTTTPTPTRTPTRTLLPTNTPTITPTATPTSTPSRTPTVTPTVTVTPTRTPTMTQIPTNTVTPTRTPTTAPLTPTATPTMTPTVSPTPTPTPSPTRTWTDQVRDQHIHSLEGVVYTPTPGS